MHKYIQFAIISTCAHTFLNLFSYIHSHSPTNFNYFCIKHRINGMPDSFYSTSQQQNRTFIPTYIFTLLHMYIFFCMYVCAQRKRKIAYFENQLKFKCQHLVIQPASPVCHQTHESYNGCSNLTPRITHSHCHSPSVHTLYSYTGCAAYGGCRHYSPLAGVTRATRLPRGHGCCACCACSNQSCSKSIAQIE